MVEGYIVHVDGKRGACGILAAMDEEARRRSLTRSSFVEMLARTMLTKVA
ncbi:MAG TPA: hypothetical protein VGC36_06110 [Rhizomicrobium sp.]